MRVNNLGEHFVGSVSYCLLKQDITILKQYSDARQVGRFCVVPLPLSVMCLSNTTKPNGFDGRFTKDASVLVWPWIGTERKTKMP